MSSSKLIKKGEGPYYQINTYTVQEMGRGAEDRSAGQEDHFVKLPVRRVPSAISLNAQGRNPGDMGSETEEDPKERLARLEKEAYEKGFEQGRKDGLALEQRQMVEKGKQLDILFTSLDQLKEQIYVESEEELLKLGLLIAKRIIREEVKSDPHVITRAVQSAYKHLVDKKKVKILINPDDMEEVKKLLPDLAARSKGGQFQVVEDDVMEQGGCRLETGFGNINASMEDQLWMLEREIDEVFKTSHKRTP